jgi:hypothetical protein
MKHNISAQIQMNIHNSRNFFNWGDTKIEPKEQKDLNNKN